MRISTLGIYVFTALAYVGCSTSTTTQARDSSGGNGQTAGQGGEQAGSAGTADSGTAGGSHATGHTGQTGGTSTSTSGQGGTVATGTELSCSAYCALVLNNCNSDTTLQYKSDVSCMNSCAAFRLGTPRDSSGNTLGCRAHYAALASADPTSNCAAAGPGGVGTCGTNCDAYCSLMATVCSSVYEDETICRSACLLMTGVAERTYQAGGSGDNLQCRIYHATFAAEGFPDVHCPHASPTPTPPCAG